LITVLTYLLINLLTIAYKPKFYVIIRKVFWVDFFHVGYYPTYNCFLLNCYFLNDVIITKAYMNEYCCYATVSL